MAALAKLLQRELILDLDAPTGEGVLTQLSAALAPEIGIGPEALQAAALAREALSSTGFGAGLAMPHVRLPEVRRCAVALGRSRQGVAFAAHDGQPVHVFLFVAGPEAEREQYTKVMAKAARFLKEEGQGLKDAAELAEAVLQAAVDY